MSSRNRLSIAGLAAHPLTHWMKSALASVLATAVSLAAADAVAAPGDRTGDPPEKPAATRKHRRAKKEGEAEKAAPPETGTHQAHARKRASRTDKDHKKAERPAAPPCLGELISLDRTGLEPQTLRLVDCKKQPVDVSRIALSVLARPWGAHRPDRLPTLRDVKVHGKTEEIAPGVRLLDPGLLTRLHAIARRFPDRTISIVSGYRPQSRGSQHESARALDLRVAGVRNEELVAFCKTMKDTGCGYYPNSSFIHVDVRNPGTGSVSWIDASGPGEGPHYVSRWPPGPEDADQAVLPVGTADHDPDPWADLGAPPRDADRDHAPTSPVMPTAP